MNVENSLSHIEKEILNLLNEGLEIRDIADKMGISHHTIKSYISKITKINKSK